MSPDLVYYSTSDFSEMRQYYRLGWGVGMVYQIWGLRSQNSQDRIFGKIHSVHSKYACKCLVQRYFCFGAVFRWQFVCPWYWNMMPWAWTGQEYTFYAFPPPVLLSRILAKVIQQPCRKTDCSGLGGATFDFATSVSASGGTGAVTDVCRSAHSETETKVWHL